MVASTTRPASNATWPAALPALSWIDLAAATVATTIQFSHEAASNVPANDAQEPNGNDGTTTSGLTRAAQVRSTADNTVFATFVDRTGAGIVPAALWTNVQGSNLAETVIFTDNETAAAHTCGCRPARIRSITRC